MKTGTQEDRTTAGQLALEVMHEIKNPLEALGHLTYLASLEADDPEKTRRYMSLAEEQMTTLNRIVRQTLGFAQSSERPRRTELAELGEAALRLHGRHIEQCKVRFVQRIPNGLTADIHPGEMLQVLSNLIANALDVLQPTGTLHLRISKSQGCIHVVVADNGPGIPAENIDRIFEPFYTTKQYRGTGLGLSLSQRIVERHHGRIRVRSCVRPGRSGTAFRVTIPA